MSEDNTTTSNNALPDSSTKSTTVVVPRGYSISQSAKSTGDPSIKDLEEGTLNESKLSTAWKSVSMGGSVFDGFLLAASQEVGQSILTLPNVFSQTGFAGGVLLELTFATLALYTNYLLVSMHAQHRHNLKEKGDDKHFDPYHIVSYHEVRGLQGTQEDLKTIRFNKSHILFLQTIDNGFSRREVVKGILYHCSVLRVAWVIDRANNCNSFQLLHS